MTRCIMIKDCITLMMKLLLLLVVGVCNNFFRGISSSSISVVEGRPMTPNPSLNYPAHKIKTNDGNAYNYERVYTKVFAKLVLEENTSGIISSDDTTTVIEETPEGYTIIYNTDEGRYEYAKVDPNIDGIGDLLRSGIEVKLGLSANPVDPIANVTLPKHIRRTPEARASALYKVPPSPASLPTTSMLSPLNQMIKTLVVPIQFSNHQIGQLQDRPWLPTKENLDIFFNSPNIDTDFAPTGSVKNVLKTLSNQHFDRTFVVLDWIPLSYTESFCAGSESTTNGQRGFNQTALGICLEEALEYIKTNSIVDYRHYDHDSNHILDSVMFVHSGYPSEMGGISEDDVYFMNRIWSHTSITDTNTFTWTSHHNPNSNLYKKLETYHIVSALHHIHPTLTGSVEEPISQGDKMVRVGVVVHQLLQALEGLDTATTTSVSSSSDNAGSWSSLSNPWGFGTSSMSQKCPPLLNPLQKLSMGWYDGTTSFVPTILDPVVDSNTFKMLQSNIASSNGSSPTAPQLFELKEGFSPNESLLIEYIVRQNVVGSNTKIVQCWPIEKGVMIWRVVQGDNGGSSPSIKLVQADLDEHVGEDTDVVTPYKLNQTIASKSIVSPLTDSLMYGRASGWSFSEITFSDVVYGVQPTVSFRVEYVMPPETMSPTKSSPPSSSTAPSRSPVESPSFLPSRSMFPTSLPSNVPSSTPSMNIPDSCPLMTQKLFIFEITTDMWGSQTTWELVDVQRGQTTLMTGGPYPNFIYQTYRYGVCVDYQDSCFKFVIRDSNSDGIFSVMDGSGYKASLYNNDGVTLYEIVDESRTQADGYRNYIFSSTGGDFGNLCRLGSSIEAPRTTLTINRLGDLIVNGTMFNIDAMPDNDLMVLRFASFHLAASAEPVTIKVYTKNGGYQGFENDPTAWTLVQTLTDIEPDGLDAFTLSTINFDAPHYVPIMAGTTQGFYIDVNPPVLVVDEGERRDIYEENIDYGAFLNVHGTDPGYMKLKSGVVVGPNFEGTTGVVALMDGRITIAPLVIGSAVTNVPSSSPSLSLVPSLTPTETPITCEADESVFELELTTDDNGFETTWQIVDVSRELQPIIVEGGGYLSSTNYQISHCLVSNGCYKFVINDSAGNGIDPTSVDAGYVLKWDGTILIDTIAQRPSYGTFTQTDGISLGKGCWPALGGSTAVIGRYATSTTFGQFVDIYSHKNIMMRRWNALHIGGPVGDSVTVKVYTKPGSYKGYETTPSIWTLVHEETLSSAGINQYTYLSTGNFNSGPGPVPLLSGTTTSFYIILNKPILYYGNAGNVYPEGSIYKQFLNVFDLLTGVNTDGGDAFTSVSTLNSRLGGKITYSDLLTIAAPSDNPSMQPSYIPSSSPSTSPSSQPSVSTVPSTGPIDCTTFGTGADHKEFRLNLQTDTMASETSWKIVDVMNSNNIVATSPAYVNSQTSQMYAYQFCLPIDSCYRFNIMDSASNGISGTGSLANGNGYKVTWDGNVEVDTMSVISGHPLFATDGIDFGNGCRPNGGGSTPTGLMSHGSSYGIMFDIMSNVDTIIRRFTSLHIGGTVGQNVNVQIYTKQGSYKGYETSSSDWIHIHTQVVQSAGQGTYTNLDLGNFNIAGWVPVLKYTSQSFYIVCDQPVLLYGNAGDQNVNFPPDTIYKSYVDSYDFYVGMINTDGIPFSASSWTPTTTHGRFSGKITFAPPEVNAVSRFRKERDLETSSLSTFSFLLDGDHQKRPENGTSTSFASSLTSFFRWCMGVIGVISVLMALYKIQTKIHQNDNEYYDSSFNSSATARGEDEEHVSVQSEPHRNVKRLTELGISSQEISNGTWNRRRDYKKVGSLLSFNKNNDKDVKQNSANVNQEKVQVNDDEEKNDVVVNQTPVKNNCRSDIDINVPVKEQPMPPYTHMTKAERSSSLSSGTTLRRRSLGAET